MLPPLYHLHPHVVLFFLTMMMMIAEYNRCLLCSPSSSASSV